MTQDELSGLDLREAVARALGWTTDTTIVGYAPGSDVPDYYPRWESSLDACFAPGGPVERLRAGFGFDLGMTEANTWIAVFYPESGDEGGGQAESVSPAEAVCRAFLKAVEEPHD